MHRFLPVVLVFAFILFLTLGGRRSIYATYQHLGYRVGLNLNNIAQNSYINWVKTQKDELESANIAVFLNKPVPFTDITSQEANILGETSQPQGEKWIEVDLSDQKLHMKEGASSVGSFSVSTGKWAPTPQGEWRIWTKLRYTRMRGGSKALGTYYDLPNVPYTMYYHQGYGIHGAYWHNDFGTPRSHGCVNMKPEEAGVVFNWASVGTRVVVHD